MAPEDSRSRQHGVVATLWAEGAGLLILKALLVQHGRLWISGALARTPLGQRCPHHERGALENGRPAPAACMVTTAVHNLHPEPWSHEAFTPCPRFLAFTRHFAFVKHFTLGRWDKMCK